MITVQGQPDGGATRQKLYGLASASAINGLRIEVITEAHRFEAIAPAWNLLVEQAGIDHPFLSHAWLLTWWQCFGAGKSLYIILIKTGKELIAAAPMMIQCAPIYGLPVRRLESIYNFHTPRYDFLLKERGEDVYRALWRAMSAGQDQWDMILLEQLPAASPTLSVFENLARSDHWLTGHWTPPASPFIHLAPDYDAWYKRIHGKQRYNVRSRYLRLSKFGPVDVEVITRQSEARKALLDGIRLEAAAWKGAAGTAICSDPSTSEFYMGFAERAAELGLLRLMFLRVGGKRIAFDYALANKSTLYGVKIGYDPEYHTYSPGHLLLTLGLKQAYAEGFTEYDFLGGQDSWKSIWTKEGRSHRWLYMFRNAVWPRVLHSMKFKAIPLVRRLRRKFNTVKLNASSDALVVPALLHVGSAILV